MLQENSCFFRPTTFFGTPIHHSELAEDTSEQPFSFSFQDNVFQITTPHAGLFIHWFDEESEDVCTLANQGCIKCLG